MKLIFPSILLLLMSTLDTTNAQTLPAPTAPGSNCTYVVLPDGKTRLNCDVTPTTDDRGTATYRDLWTVMCRTKINDVETVITVDVLNVELQFISLPAMITALVPVNPANPAPGTVLFSEWNPPTSPAIQKQYTVTKAVWDALPAGDRWGSVKQQPPTQYARLPVSGTCISKILEKLRFSSDEPY